MKIIIGIDPDIEKSGVASNDGTSIELKSLRFFELLDYMKKAQKNYEHILVFIEAGWLNKGNWHKKNKGSAALNAKIGQRTGANHEAGRKIVEMMGYLKIPHKEVKPTQSKVNARLFKMITKLQGTHNQDKRDAYMLIHGLKI